MIISLIKLNINYLIVHLVVLLLLIHFLVLLFIHLLIHSGLDVQQPN